MPSVGLDGEGHGLDRNSISWPSSFPLLCRAGHKSHPMLNTHLCLLNSTHSCRSPTQARVPGPSRSSITWKIVGNTSSQLYSFPVISVTVGTNLDGFKTRTSAITASAWLCPPEAGAGTPPYLFQLLWVASSPWCLWLVETPPPHSRLPFACVCVHTVLSYESTSHWISPHPTQYDLVFIVCAVILFPDEVTFTGI